MYRGSTAVLQYNARFYEDLIRNVVAKQKSEMWDIDVDTYGKDTMKLVDLKNEIEEELRKRPLTIKRKGRKITQEYLTTLSTKIMLGVFGNTPAFDTNIRNEISGSKDYGVALDEVKNIYEKNDGYFDKQRNKRKTISFGDEGKRYHYTIAKLVDMYAWQKYDKRPKKKKWKRAES
jgi:hypothetical protein